MPELPEVETIKRQLNKYLVGHFVSKVEVRNRRIVSGEATKLCGSKVLAVRRFGKVTVIDFSNNLSLAAHVKMTGQFIYKGPNSKSNKPLSPKVVGGVPGPHTHLIIYLGNQGVLYYNDYRRFSWVKIVPSSEVLRIPFIKKLGPEPLKDLDLRKFKAILAKSRKKIKTLLMDQEKIGGVGNIYANDALWLAKINPKRQANLLTDSESSLLYSSLIQVLKTALAYGGTSEQAYVAPDGTEGRYQNVSKVYGRDGELCQRCKKGKILKFFLGGRGTYTCSLCQR